MFSREDLGFSHVQAKRSMKGVAFLAYLVTPTEKTFGELFGHDRCYRGETLTRVYLELWQCIIPAGSVFSYL